MTAASTSKPCDRGRDKQGVSKTSVTFNAHSRTKKLKPAAPDRVLTDVLLSIKPVHLANIVSRQKNHEYRKYRLRDGVTRLWLYETGDDGGRRAISHIALIPPYVRHSPGSVPEEPFGIGNSDFNAGLKESTHGYRILELYELVPPVTLTEMKSQWGIASAPMGWRYVPKSLWDDRWGEEKEKEIKTEMLKRIF